MTQQSAFRVQILDKLGAPLMQAISAASARGADEAADTKKEAERMAELVAKTIQVSIGLAGSMELKDSDAMSDSIRLALAGLSAPLVAHFYTLTGKPPGDADIKKIIKSMEAALTFADNFAPAAESAQRLEALEPGGSAPADEVQINIQYMRALVPVINAVAEFPFGRPETKLVQDIASRLTSCAETIRKNLPGIADEKQGRHAELALLKGLGDIYAACHKNEMKRLMAMDEKARAAAAQDAGGALPMDPVWQMFELRAGMVEALGVGESSDQASASPAPAVAAPPPSQPPAAEQPPPPPPSAGVPPPVAQEEGGDFNPMAFFKPGAKKPSEDESSGG